MWKCGRTTFIASLGLLTLGGVAAFLSPSEVRLDRFRSRTAAPEVAVRFVFPQRLSNPDGAPAAEVALAASIRERLARAMQRFDGAELDDEFVRLADGVAASEIAALLCALAPAELDSVFAVRLLDRWAEQDPHEATLWADNLLAAAPQRERLLRIAVEHWAAKELPRALMWFDALTAGATKESLRAVVAGSAVHTAPVTALRLALELPDQESQRASLLHAAVTEWSRLDLPAALDWVQRQPADLRDELVAPLIASWSRHDSAAALNFALTAPFASSAQERALKAFLRWSSPGPWMHTIPDEVLNRTTVRTFAGLWTASDPLAALNWLGKLDRGPVRDEAVAAFALTIARRDPNAAEASVAQIEDPVLRAQCREMLGDQ